MGARLSGAQLEAVRAALEAGLAPLRAQRPQTLSEWAAQHFKLSAESSHTQGDWEAYAFQVGWMDAFSNDDIEEVNVVKSKRVGYTKTLLAFIGYNAAHRRRKQALYQPTDDDRDSFVKSELEPMLRDCPSVAKMQAAGGDKDSIKLKVFQGSLAHFLGGKAARAYRRITCAVVCLDELDGFDQTVEKSADPVTLARGRLEGAPFPKLVAGTTPRIKGLSHIERRAGHAGARMRYNIECPHCGVEHPIAWGGAEIRHGMKWETDPETGEVINVRHVCPHCHGSINQAQYLSVYGAGAWVDEAGAYRYGQDRVWRDAAGMPCLPPKHVAFFIWTAYSPQRAWPDIVREFREAHQALKRGDAGPMAGFVNETLGETWEEEFEQTEADALKARAEDYPLRTVPYGGVEVVVGVDTQGDRWELVWRAVGRGEEAWTIDYEVIYGNPADEREWDAKLAPALRRTVTHQSGIELAAAAVLIDTGGHHTHQVYGFVRRNPSMPWYAGKGESREGKPVHARCSLVDVNDRGRIYKRGVRLWFVGTDTAKDLLHGRLQVATPGPGYEHHSKHLPDAFFKGLTAEVRVPVRTDRGEYYRWVKPAGARNEPLDCTVYGMWCSNHLGLHTRAEKAWAAAEARLQPDLFAAPAPSDNAGTHTEQRAETAAPPPLPRVMPRPARPVNARQW